MKKLILLALLLPIAVGCASRPRADFATMVSVCKANNLSCHVNRYADGRFMASAMGPIGSGKFYFGHGDTEELALGALLDEIKNPSPETVILERKELTP